MRRGRVGRQARRGNASGRPRPVRKPLSACRPLPSEADPPSASRPLLFEEGDAGREAVQAVVGADRTDFPLREEAGSRDRPEAFGDAAGVVMGLVEEPGATAVAGEDEGARRLPERAAVARQKFHQILNLLPPHKKMDNKLRHLIYFLINLIHLVI